MTSGARSLQHEARQRGRGEAVGTRSGRGWHAQEERGRHRSWGAVARLPVVRRAGMHARMLLTPQRCSSHLCWDGPSRSLQSTARGSRTNGQSRCACMHPAITSMHGCCGGRWVSGRRGPVLGAAGGACMLRSYPQPAHLLCACNGRAAAATASQAQAMQQNRRQEVSRMGCLVHAWGCRGLGMHPNSVRGPARLSPLLKPQCRTRPAASKCMLLRQCIPVLPQARSGQVAAKLIQAGPICFRSWKAPAGTYRLHSAP